PGETDGPGVEIVRTADTVGRRVERTVHFSVRDRAADIEAAEADTQVGTGRPDVFIVVRQLDFAVRTTGARHEAEAVEVVLEVESRRPHFRDLARIVGEGRAARRQVAADRGEAEVAVFTATVRRVGQREGEPAEGRREVEDLRRVARELAVRGVRANAPATMPGVGEREERR